MVGNRTAFCIVHPNAVRCPFGCAARGKLGGHVGGQTSEDPGPTRVAFFALAPALEQLGDVIDIERLPEIGKSDEVAFDRVLMVSGDKGVKVGAPTVSGAKVMAGEAALRNARTCIQVHGGMGYTWEVVAHYYLKRTWVLENTFGTSDAHAEIVAERLDAQLG